MAKDQCVYHAEQPASWHCTGCGTLLCQACFPAAPDPVRPPYCALCGGNMAHLGMAHALPPFWSQMPRFFAYPFKPNGAAFLAFLALLTVVAAKLFAATGILILLPVFIVGSLTIRQGLRVIEFCGQGRSHPPTIAELFDGNPATLKMIGLMLSFGILVGSLSRFGIPGMLFIVCLSALLPASIMVLAVHGSLRAALSPMQVLALATRTGWSYLGLVLVLIVTSQGPQKLLTMIPPASMRSLAQHHPELLVALLVISTAYFNMVMGAMMGYLLFQHHQDLGIEPDAEHAVAPVDRRALELARAVILVRESRYEDALRHLAGTITDYPQDVALLEYHHKLLCESGGAPERVTQHTERYLDVLMKARRTGRLVSVLEAARRVVPHYRPASTAVRTALADEYFQQRQCKPAIALIGMLHKEAPGDPALPAAYHLLARIYSEGMRDDGKAIMILDYLLQHFPDHALAADIQNYRKVILALGQANQAGACAAT